MFRVLCNDPIPPSSLPLFLNIVTRSVRTIREAVMHQDVTVLFQRHTREVVERHDKGSDLA